MRYLVLIIAVVLTGCGPSCDDVAAQIRKIPPDRIERIITDSKDLLARDHISPPPSSDRDDTMEWFGYSGLPAEYADLKPVRVWLNRGTVNLCFYRGGDYSVNLDVDWPDKKDAIATLSWGDFRSEKTEVIWRKKAPNQALVPTVMSVTPAADAPVAPGTTAAHL